MATKSKSHSATKEPHKNQISTSGYANFIANWKSKKPVSLALSRFIPDVLSDSEVTTHVHGVIRGHELLRSAKGWTRPTIGSGPSAECRGLQWRLVMAYNGIELLIKSLIRKANARGIEEADLITVFKIITLPNFEPIRPPSLSRKNLAVWLDNLEHEAVLSFLKTEKGDKNLMRSWLLNQQPVTEWPSAILLSKALRNCTAHGALSPNKIEQWGLKSAFICLTKLLFSIDEEIFKSLVAEY
ncbi:MAG: hypothetical protein NTZ94_02970 [Verrucomicrobia bacterium]|nr:hypothetical protein [Verrucomicrobiota bacterium]